MNILFFKLRPEITLNLANILLENSLTSNLLCICLQQKLEVH